jgi:hypothetical protein
MGPYRDVQSHWSVGYFEHVQSSVPATCGVYARIVEESVTHKT